MDNNLANVDLPRNGPPDPLLPMCDNNAVPIYHTLEVERLTTSSSRHPARMIRFFGVVNLISLLVLTTIALHVWIFYTDQGHFINCIIAAVYGMVCVETILFCIYAYLTLGKGTQDFVLEMERSVIGTTSEQRLVEDTEGDPWERGPPIMTQSSVLSMWTPRISSVTYQNRTTILTPLGTGTQRDQVIEKMRMAPHLFKIERDGVHYMPLTQELDDRLPAELMIPKIHQLGIDPQLLATRVNQAANSIDMSSTVNQGRKDALIASRTRPGAPDPWSLTVAFVTADVQNRTKLGDQISAFLLAQ